jgi:hypothetical protein
VRALSSSLSGLHKLAGRVADFSQGDGVEGRQEESVDFHRVWCACVCTLEQTFDALIYQKIHRHESNQIGHIPYTMRLLSRKILFELVIDVNGWL